MTRLRLAALPIVAAPLLPGLVRAADDVAADISKAEDAVALFRQTDPSLKKFFERSVGYAVFPSVAKGAFIVGGAGGKGVLFEKGKAVGLCSLAQVTIGLAAGGQEYAEIIFFENALALTNFKGGNFTFSSQVSAVAAASGAAATAKYQQGVAVFTVAIGGLMFEASVGGQKFDYKPLPAKK